MWALWIIEVDMHWTLTYLWQYGQAIWLPRCDTVCLQNHLHIGRLFIIILHICISSLHWCFYFVHHSTRLKGTSEGSPTNFHLRITQSSGQESFTDQLVLELLVCQALNKGEKTKNPNNIAEAKDYHKNAKFLVFTLHWLSFLTRFIRRLRLQGCDCHRVWQNHVSDCI